MAEDQQPVDELLRAYAGTPEPGVADIEKARARLRAAIEEEKKPVR